MTTQTTQTKAATTDAQQVPAVEFAHIDLTTLTIEANVRTTATLGKDFVASIKEHGVLVPIVAVRTGDGTLHVRAGQRRTLGAIEAGVASIPVRIIDATCDADRIVQQIIENDQRLALVDADRIAGFEQLSLMGLSAAQIARRAHTKKATVEHALTVAATTLTAAATHKYGLTLDLVERARQLAGLKGYVTNLPIATMDGAAVIAAYHDLWRVEQSFRMTKSDLRARLVFHHQRDAIEAHLTCSPPLPWPATCKMPPASASRRSSRPCAPHAQRPSRSTANDSPSTPTSPTPPAPCSPGSKQVTKRLARVRSADAGDWLMPKRRKPKLKLRRTPPRKRPAVFPQPTAQPHGQPTQSGRPHVTSRMNFAMVPRFDTATPPPSPGGSPGTYQLTYVLGIPGRAVVQHEVDFAKLVRAGDSLLEVPSGVHSLDVALRDDAGHERTATVNISPAHRLRDIELELQADNFAQAAAVGYDLVAPLLSRWAFLHDVAIVTSAVQIVETATQIHQWSQLMLGAVKSFSNVTAVSDSDHRVLLSAYREGISSTEPLWQALSLFRVSEGVLQMRQARASATVTAGGIPAEPSERVPTDLTSVGQANDAGLPDSLKPHTGKKFTAVLDSIRPTLRNAIAHLDPDNTVLVQDRWADLQEVEHALPGLRWIARQLLDAELQQH
jgi:ParB/RepB/Spo0J family partition protein